MKKILLTSLVIFCVCYAGLTSGSDWLANDKVLYKSTTDSGSDEYAEGGIYIYDFAEDVSQLVIDGIMIDRSEAWLMPDDNILLFTIKGIYILDQQGNVVDQHSLADNRLIAGAAYQVGNQEAVFLMVQEGQLSLHGYNLASNKVELLVDKVPVTYSGIEEPFKSMFFLNENTVLINNNCSNNVIFNLKNKDIVNLPFNDENCFGYNIYQTKDGFVYYIYTNKERTSYQIAIFSSQDQKRLEVRQESQSEGEPIPIKVYSDHKSNSFFVKINDELYSYNGTSMNKAETKELNEVVLFRDRQLLFVTSDGRVTSKQTF